MAIRERMNRRTCPDCGARSYSSCSETSWDCPICEKNLSNVPNDPNPWSHLVKVLESDRVRETIRLQEDLLPE